MTAGDVTVVEPGLVGSSLRESVVLSDGVTVVEIDGAAEPTVDIRAGTLEFANDLTTNEALTGSFVEINSINSQKAFISNQFNENPELTGNIAVVNISANVDADQNIFRDLSFYEKDRDAIILDSKNDVISTKISTGFSINDLQGDIPELFDLNDDFSMTSKASAGNIFILAAQDINIDSVYTGMHADWRTSSIPGRNTNEGDAGKITIRNSGDLDINYLGSSIDLFEWGNEGKAGDISIHAHGVA